METLKKERSYAKISIIFVKNVIIQNFLANVVRVNLLDILMKLYKYIPGIVLIVNGY